MPVIGAALGNLAFGAMDKFRSDPVSQARKYLQIILTLTFGAWLVMALYGRRLAADGEPGASREFDVSDHVDAWMGETADSSGSGSSSGSSSSPSAGGTPSANRALGQKMAAERGWTGQSWSCLDNLIQGESGWDDKADNPTSTAYGIGQRLGSVHGMPKSYRNSPTNQIKWTYDYISGRYGSPCRAWAFKRANGYY